MNNERHSDVDETSNGNEETDKEETQLAPIDPNEESIPDIFRISNDCFEDIDETNEESIPDIFRIDIDCFKDVNETSNGNYKKFKKKRKLVAIRSKELFIPEIFKLNINETSNGNDKKGKKKSKLVAIGLRDLFIPEIFELNINKTSNRNEEKGKEESQLAAVGQNKQNPPGIFKLNMDCLEYIFDLLSLSCLIEVGGTCTRLRQYTGYFYRINYPFIRIELKRNIYRAYNYGKRMDIFQKFIENITLTSETYNDNLFEKCVRIGSNNLPFLKEILFNRVIRTPHESIKEILRKIEVVKFIYCQFQDDAFDSIFSACENMKHLEICSKSDDYLLHSIIIGTNNTWLYKKYPKLEHFLLKFDVGLLVLRHFFLMNPQIKMLTISSDCLWKSYQFLAGMNIKFDTLTVTITNAASLYAISNQLLSLYDEQFYKRLRIYHGGFRFEQHTIDFLIPLKSLVQLNIGYCEDLALSNFTELEEFSVYNSIYIIDWHELPDKLLNLRRIYVANLYTDMMFTMISRAPKLNVLQISAFYGEDYYDSRRWVLDVVELDKARRKLKGAQKLTIYLNDDIYLATNLNFNETNFELIQIKRTTSSKWRDLFDIY